MSVIHPKSTVVGTIQPHYTEFCIDELFEAQVMRTPTAIAVVCEAGELTYESLDRRASALARRLQDNGVGRGSVVGLLAERHPDMVAGLLAILKAGGAYLPLEPDLPDERLAYYMRKAGAGIVLTQPALLDRARALAPSAAVAMVPGDEDAGDGESGDRAPARDPAALAYVMFTSGSTGSPKGVMIEHRSVCNRLLWMADAGILGVRDRILQRTPFSFDASVWEIFVPLIVGARLCLARPGGHRDPAYHVAAIRTWQVTALQTVPSFLALLLEEPEIGACRSLRRLFFGGEAAPRSLLDQARRLPVECFNLYGPTEACIDVTCWPCTPVDSAVLPIGRPNANIRIDIVDDAFRPLPIGSAGQIVISGPCLGRGYIGEPELTAAQFRAAPGLSEVDRFYCTGDLGRIRDDGVVEFLGRRDAQVKIAGMRIEPVEIENALRIHPEVAQAAVLVRRTALGPRLAAFVAARGGGNLLPQALKEHLAARLPHAMVPAQIRILPDLPRSSSDKIDLTALGMLLDGGPPDPPAPDMPEGELETRLATLWQQALGLQRIGRSEDFLWIGGNSLAAVRLSAEIRAALQVDCTVTDIFAHRTIAGQAEILRERLDGRPAAVAGAPPMQPEPASWPGEDGWPLSAAQHGMWIEMQRLGRGGSSYNMPQAYGIRGPLDAERLAGALNHVLRRHRSLACRIRMQGGEPRMAPVRDPHLAMARRRAAGPELSRLLSDEAARPFDLERELPVRAMLIQSGPDEHVLLLTVHHIVADDWSLAVALQDLDAAYAGHPQEPAPGGYQDFVQWQQQWSASAAAATGLEHWRRQLAGCPTLTTLATDGDPDPDGAASACSLTFEEPAEVLHRLRAVARGLGATEFMVALTVFAELLASCSRSEEVVVGTPASGRSLTQWARVVGLFVNLLPLRIRTDRQASFAASVQQNRDLVLQALRHQDVPFARIVDALEVPRIAPHPPLVQVTFAYQAEPLPTLRLGGLAVEPVPVPPAQPKFLLEFELADRDGRLQGRVNWNGGLLSRHTVAELAAAYGELLRNALADPDRSRPELQLLPEPRRRAVIEAVIAAEQGADGLPPVHADVAAQPPHRTALEERERRIGYGELSGLADALTGRLRECGVAPGSRVVVCLPRGIDQAVAQLAVLRRGAAYVPLDDAMPAQRIRELCEAVRPAAIVATQAYGHVFPEDSRLILPPLAGLPVEPSPQGRRSAAVGPASPAYVIFTSGSSGRPKAVEIPHRGLSNLVRWHHRAFHITPADRAGRIAGSGFDAAAWELWPYLAAGATVVFPTPADLRSAEAVRSWILEAALTVTFVPTPLAELLMQQPWPAGTPLRLLLTGGDRLTRRPAAGLPFEVVNNYGPTEASVVSTSGAVSSDGGRRQVPDIGAAIDNVVPLILDANRRLLPDGAAGELYLGGAALATGYCGEPELTREAFPEVGMGAGRAVRLYRTGDICRRREDGCFEYLGRADDQLQVRGFRIEPAEIEGTLARHPEVAACAAIAEPAAQGATLAAFVVLRDGAGATGAELADWLRGRLPAYMVPQRLELLPALPLTGNGKVDRKALQQQRPRGHVPQQQRPRADVPQPPSGPVEATLAGIWAALLGRDVADRRNSFFEVGGHSLAAMRMLSRIEEEFGIELRLLDIYQRPSVADLARHIETMAPATRNALPERHGAAEFPLAPMQRPVLAAMRILGDQVRYNSFVCLRLQGALHADRLAEALRRVVRQHTALRSVFPDATAAPVQRVLPGLWPRVSLSALEPGDIGAFLDEACHARFDLARGPLVSLDIGRLGPADHVAVLTVHHLVMDGWSMEIVLRQLAAAYAEGDGWHGPASDYGSFAGESLRDLQDGRLQLLRGFWRAHLEDAPWRLALPLASGEAEADPHLGHAVPIEVPADVLLRLDGLAARSGTTLHSVLLAGFLLLLDRHGAGPDLLVGIPVANRMRSAFQDTVGLFANLVPLHVRLGRFRPLVTELIAEVGRGLSVVLEHQELPLDEILQAAGAGDGRRPLPVLFSLQEASSASFALPGVEVQPLSPPRLSVKFDLAVAVQRTPRGLSGSIEFAARTFRRPDMQAMAARLQALWQALPEHAGEPWAELAALTGPELQAALFSWSGMGQRRPRAGTVVTEFVAQALRRPDRPAIECGTASVSYAELERRSRRLAERLVASGLRPDDLVGICMRPGPALIVAVLGVLRAGGAYLPLDPEHPPERLGDILDQAMPRRVLAEPATRAALNRAHCPVLLLDEQQEGCHGEADPAAIDAAGRDDLAYVIFTSGSTGQPKGVMIEHGGLHNVAMGLVEHFGVTGESRVLQFVSLAFDVAAADIAMALCAGATLVLVDRHAAPGGKMLADAISRTGVTHCQLPVSVLASLPPGDCPDLQVVVAGGEACHPEIAGRWGDGRRFFNAYGPTEASVCTTTWEWDGRGDAVPIGRPLPNALTFVLDGQHRPVPPGAAGELYVGGLGLARGYLGRPDLDELAFAWLEPTPGLRLRLYRTGDVVRHLPDGSLLFLGRSDEQVKLRGHRIEPGEVKGCLLRHPAVRDAAVVLSRDDMREPALMAYAAAEGISEAELLAHLRSHLPGPMVPSRIVVLERLPLTPNGKVDLAALADLQPSRTRGATGADISAGPPDALLDVVLQTWRSVLGTPALAPGDDVFSNGGHSLSAAIVAGRLSVALGVEIPLRTIFDAPTAGALAARLGGRPAAATAPATAATPAPDPDGPHSLSIGQEEIWFATVAGNGAAYNMPSLFRLRGTVDAAVLGRALRSLVDRHRILRSRFHLGAERLLCTYAGVPDQVLSVIGPGADGEDALLRTLAAEARRPFDLEHGPLYRFHLGETADGLHLLLLNFHHSIADGWSIGLLLRDLEALYQAGLDKRAAPPLPAAAAYPDYARRQRQRLDPDRATDLARFWRQYLDGAPDLRLPGLAGSSTAGEDPSRRIHVPEEVAQGLRRIAAARAAGTTMFMVLLGGFAVALGRISGSQDMVIGTDVANRGRPELEQMVGPVVNQIPVRCTLRSDQSFLQLCVAVRDSALSALSHADLPFSRIVDALKPERASARRPIIRAKLVLQPPVTGLQLPGLDMEEVPLTTGEAKFDLLVSLRETGSGLEGRVECRSGVVDEALLAALDIALNAVLAAAAAHPESRVCDLAAAADLAERGDGTTRRAAFRRGRSERLHALRGRRAGSDAEAIP